MKILIDFGHPAHIHYFKNFIKLMKANGHEFSIVARDKEVLHQLLDNLGFAYTNRGKGKKTLLGKIFYLFIADYTIYRVARKFKPDIFLSFSSTYAAHVSRLQGKPHIVFDDTEHAKFELMMYPPFSDVILNPKPFWKQFSHKQIYFDGYMELCHLHPNYFIPDPSIVSSYGIDPKKPYFILRFVSWDASHDVGQSGLPIIVKTSIISQLESFGRVLISSEGPLPEDLEKYRIIINPIHLHHFLSFASLYIGEGATTASECIILGTPAIYVNSLNAGTISEQSEKYGLISMRNSSGINNIIADLLVEPGKIEAKKNQKRLINDKIDVTAFMVWFVENYPASEKTMRENPDYQYTFK